MKVKVVVATFLFLLGTMACSDLPNPLSSEGPQLISSGTNENGSGTNENGSGTNENG